MPVVSLGETQVRPTAMLWRNMAAMAIEELIRANPVDGVVLLGGCDKTIPALLMGAASVDLPAVVVPGRPDADGHVRRRTAGLRYGRVAAVGGDARRHAVPGAVHGVGVVHDPQQGTLQHDGHGVDDGVGTEALGATLPGTAGLPAPDSRLLAKAHDTGRLVVEMVSEGRRPSRTWTAASFRNAIVAFAALGGSTNAVVHLLAVAGRLGVPLGSGRFRRDRRRTFRCWSTYSPPGGS